MQFADLEDVCATFEDIIVCFVASCDCCELRTRELCKRVKKQAIEDESDEGRAKEDKGGVG